jgi:hypothetical protein
VEEAVSQRNTHRIGVIVAVVLGAIGLVTIAVFVVGAILMQSFGSNK